MFTDKNNVAIMLPVYVYVDSLRLA